MRDQERLKELAAFIRHRREDLDPATVGVAIGGRRRTPGLRREEIAHLAGMSVTWYTWIEQGRPVSASQAVLSRLAAVLRLNRAERGYLFELAGKRDPDDRADCVEEAPAEALAAVEEIACPAYLLDGHWDARAWNTPAEQLFVGWLDKPGQRNLLKFIFLAGEARALIRDWPVRARRVTAEYRAATSQRRDDPRVQADLAELRAASPEFRQYWEDQSVLTREGGLRTFSHPTRGRLGYTQLSFELSGHPDWKLTILRPASRRRSGPDETSSRR